MKVLLINGSPRKEGNTATALAEVAKQLTKEGIESENINFTIPIKKLLIVEHTKKNISWSFFSNALNF